MSHFRISVLSSFGATSNRERKWSSLEFLISGVPNNRPSQQCAEKRLQSTSKIYLKLLCLLFETFLSKDIIDRMFAGTHLLFKNLTIMAETI